MQTKHILSAALAAVVLVSQAQAGARYGARLTVSGYGGSTELADFPVLVKVAERDVSAGTGIVGFDYSDMAQPATGADLWFSTDAAGNNVIPHDIDEWHENGTSFVWVSVPKLVAGATFYMHYGDAAPPAYAPSNVWLRAGYIGVWHMNEESGNVADSTGHGLTAVPKGSRAATDSVGVADGAIGTCRQNSRSASRGNGNNNCYLQVAPSEHLSAIDGCCTASQWLKFSGVSYNNTRPYSRKTNYSEGTGFECEISGSSATIRCGGTSSVVLPLPAVTQWFHLAAVYNGVFCNAYGNGGSTSNSGTISSIGSRSDTGYGIGSNANGSEICLNGWMDEYRLRGAASSADWVKAEYETATVADFLTYGQVADESSAVTVSGFPVEYGAPTPDYGLDDSHSAGDPLTFTAPDAVFIDAGGTTRAVCTGWKLYDKTTGALEDESGDGDAPNACDFAFTKPVVLIWQWKRQFLVSVSASTGGSATTSFWADDGAAAQVAATPDAGCEFYRWDVSTDTPGIDAGSASLSFTVSAPVALSAMFLGGEPVAKTYTGANNGSWEVASNWTPAGVPTISDDITVPNGRRVAAKRGIYAHSITLAGSGAISIGGATTAYDASCDFSGASNYGTSSAFGRKADDFKATVPVNVDVLGDVAMSGSSQLIVGGHNSPVYKTVSIGGDLTLSGTARLAVYAGKGDMASEPEKGGAAVRVAGKATFRAGTILDAFCNVNVVGGEAADKATGAFVLLSFGSAEVAAGATIRSRLGVGMITDPSLIALGCPAMLGNSLAGGGHGGRGGSSASTAGGAAYDSEIAPILPGAAGSLARTLGGGVVRLDTGKLTLDGTISASASYTGSQHERGAPAGGSVWITCESYSLGETASVTADGANGTAFQSYSIGGGAGGRIAIATGLSDTQKTELARTGTTSAISAPASLLQIHPGQISVSAGTGVLNGTDGEDGTAVLYSYLDSSRISIAIATAPSGLAAAGFSPAVNSVASVARSEGFAASAPAAVPVAAGSRRLVTGWEATRVADGSLFASGDGATAYIPEATENLALTWKYETLQHSVDIDAVGNGSVSGAASGWFNDGSTLSLSATPANGASLRGWIRGAFLTGDEALSPTLSAEVDRPLKIAAVFTGGQTLSSKTFVGASGASWEEADNWSPPGIPGVADAVAIPAETVVAVHESATAGSLTLGANATLSVFGATTAFYQSVEVLGIAYGTIGRFAADASATDICPSIEVAGDFIACPGASVAVGGIRQRGQSLVSVFGNLSLGPDARMSVYAGQTVEGRIGYADGTGAVRVGGTLSLADGALLDLVGYYPDLSFFATPSRIPVSCEVLDVAAGARLAANFPYGYPQNFTPRTGIGGDNGRVAGGGHGGAGGGGSFGDGSNAAAGGIAWDSVVAPLYPGSPGRALNDYGAIGGGAVRVVAREIRLAGEINADAVYHGKSEYGGAPGGSIWLVCDSFSAEPTALLSARGMDGGEFGTYNCGGGGGGRVSVCIGLGRRRIDGLAAGESGSGLAVTDQTAEGARYHANGDVSGGAPSRSGEAGSDGTFVTVSRAGTIVIMR